MGGALLHDSDFTTIDYITYFISTISITFSSFLIYIIKHTKELNSNTTNQFIILLTISEMINNITQFSSLFATWLENLNNMFDESLRVCFFQIYCNVFSNIMSLLSSLLISLYIYDAFFYNNKIFSMKKSVNIAKGVTVYVSLILSLVFFIIHMEEFQNTEEIQHKRVISCWISGTLDYGLIAIYVIATTVICILSYRVGKDVKAYRKELKESGEKNNINDDRYGKVKLIHRMLNMYPVVTVFVYGVISIARIMTYISLNYQEQEGTSSLLLGISYWMFAVATNLRGFVFASVYLFTEKRFKERFVFYLCGGGCKGDKEEERDTNNSLQMIEQRVIDDDEEDYDGDVY